MQLFSEKAYLRMLAFWQRYLSHRQLYRMNHLLFDCALRGMGYMNHENAQVSGERHFIDTLLPQYLPDEKAPLFIDVGANCGDYSQMLRSAFPHAAIHAFEPHPKTFEALMQRGIANLTGINSALGSRRQSAILYDRSDRPGSHHASMYEEVINTIHHRPALAFDIKLTTLDHYLRESGISGDIHLLKIDTEGHELEALKGASETLRSQRVHLIQIEFNEMNVFSRVFMRDFLELLPGFQPYRLLPKGVVAQRYRPLTSELFTLQNIVFVHDSFRPDSQMRPAAPRRRVTN